MKDYSRYNNDFITIDPDGNIRASVQTGAIRDAHTDHGTGAVQQYHRVPVQKYVSYGAAHKVDKYGKRVYQDTGNNSIPFGALPGDWQSRSRRFNQSKIDEYLKPDSPRYNPANYERLMAQARCDAYDELVACRESGQYAWDSMSSKERAELRISNPQRAEALENDFFSRIMDDDGNFYDALKYGYTQEEIDNPHVYNPHESQDLPNEGKSVPQEIQSMEQSEAGIRANPSLKYDEELERLKQLDEKQLKTGFHAPQEMYGDNNGFLGESKDSYIKSGDVFSRYEGIGRSGDRGRFTSLAKKGEDGVFRSPSFRKRSMVEAEEEMEESLFELAHLPPADSVDDDHFETSTLDGLYGPEPVPETTDVIPFLQEKVDHDDNLPFPEAVEAEVPTTLQSTPPAEASQPASAQSAILGDRYQSSYADCIRQTPSLESNRWAGDRGESVCAPQSSAARLIMEERGLSGVQYQNGIPDFSPFSESTVKLGYMTDARHSRGLTDGRDGKDTVYTHYEDGEIVSVSHHADKSSMADIHMKYDKPGNFEQADALTAEQWTADGRDGRAWTAQDVAQYRQDHGLTWHECNDMETMQMIPEAINADFGHLGGVGEVKETQRIVEEALRDYDDGQMVEPEDYDRMTPDELEAATREHGYYDEDGVWIPDSLPKNETEEFTPDNPLDDRPGDSDDLPPDDHLPLDGIPDDGGENPPDEKPGDSDDLPPDDHPPLDGIPDDGGDNPPDEKPDGSDDLPPEDHPSVDSIPDDGGENPPDEKPDGSDDLPPDDQLPVDVIPDDGGDNQPDSNPDRSADTLSDTEKPVESIPNRSYDNALDEETALDTQEDTEQVTEEQAAEETIAQEAVSQEAEEQAVQEAEEQAVQETGEQAVQEAEEQAAQEAEEQTAQEAEEQAAQEAEEQEVEEQAAQEAVEPETEVSYDDLYDEQSEEDSADIEDYDDLEDQSIEDATDDSAYDDLADDATEDYADESGDYSDMADDMDTGSYDDSSFDSSDVSFDSGDTGSFDGGGDSIE